MSGIENFSYDVVDQDGITQEEFFNITRGITYISIPIYYGYKYKRIALYGGFQGSVAISSWSRLNGTIPVNPLREIGFVSRGRSGLDEAALSFGSRLGLTLTITDKVSFDANYYYGLTNVSYVTGFESMDLRVRQITFGFRYSLCNH